MGVQKSHDLEADIEVDILVDEEPKVHNEYVEVEGHQIFTLNCSIGESQKCTVVLLHDQINDSNSWSEIKTLQTLGLYGYKAIALDLPSHGRSSGPALHKAETRGEFLTKFLETPQLGDSKLILVGVSMAGQYLIPFLNQLEDHLRGRLIGFVGVGLSDCVELDLQVAMPKTLLIRGEMDTSIGLNASNALKNVENVRQFVMPAGKHLCHLGNPQLFNKVLVNFLNSIQSHQNHNSV